MSTVVEQPEVHPAADAPPPVATAEGAATGSAAPMQVRCPARAPAAPVEPRLQRMLRIRVPVIARLAATRMVLADVRRMTCGSIIKLDKSVDADLELLINNHVVGQGIAVKVGDYFGLRIREIGDRAARIRSLGK